MTKEIVFSTVVTLEGVLNMTLKALSALDPDGSHPPTVATQLSVIAWNRYEFDALEEIIVRDSCGVDIAVRHPEYEEVLLQRGTLKSEFDLCFGSVAGVRVTLYKEIDEKVQPHFHAPCPGRITDET
jgi:hypothetical protein